MDQRVSFQLGKLAPREDPRDLKLARYTAKLLPPPGRCDFTTAVNSWPVFLNDRLGDCTIADEGHKVELVSALGQGTEATVTDNDVLHAYEAVGGYKPDDPSTDQGCVMADVMDYMRKTGLAGHRSIGYASVNPKNHLEVRQAIVFFGGLHAGLGLPVSAQNEVGKTWRAHSGTSGKPYGWGGHDAFIVGYDRYGLWCITWGMVQRLTWAFLDKYCDEAFVSLWPEWISPTTAKSPQGIGMDDLRADLGQFS